MTCMQPSAQNIYRSSDSLWVFQRLLEPIRLTYYTFPLRLFRLLYFFHYSLFLVVANYWEHSILALQCPLTTLYPFKFVLGQLVGRSSTVCTVNDLPARTASVGHWKQVDISSPGLGPCLPANLLQQLPAAAANQNLPPGNYLGILFASLFRLETIHLGLFWWNSWSRE